MYPVRKTYYSPSTDVFSLMDEFFKTDTVRASFKVNVKENENEYGVEAVLPGFKKEDIEIKYNDNYLTISVKKVEESEEETDKYIHRETSNVSMARKVYLKGIDQEKISAKLVDGILQVVVPKAEEAKPIEITVE
jgi:HSP20 family protein